MSRVSSTFVAAKAVRHAGGQGYQFVKRATDLLISVAFLFLLLPLWLLIAVLIKIDSRGPVLFASKVVGKDGRNFTLYKFRSMRPASNRDDHRLDVQRNFLEGRATAEDEKGRPVFKTALLDASRITRIGKVLRRTSLDEAPQFWNVVRGEMSLVGPRPALVYEAELYDEAQRRRFAVKPGLTGLYQVLARNRVPISEMVRLDLEYAERQSLWLDLLIMAKTPMAMLSGI
jgi:lipopolysaccharide/colanic/teichoic acid biosynthesis glycosyltransferase